MMTEQDSFGRFRGTFFPIYGHELKKLIPLTLIFFCISFNYSVLRSFKDMLMYTNMVDGRKSIYCAKVLVIPSIFFLTFLYTFIAKRVNRDVRFNIVTFFFAAFFFSFVLFAYPGEFNEALQISWFDKYIDSNSKLAPWFDCLRKWPITIFYIFVESWGTIMLGVSFWTFANEINSSKQAKRVYSFFMIGAAIGSIFAGLFIKAFENDTFINLIVPCVLIFVLALVYNYLGYKVRKYPVEYEIEEKIEKKKKVKLSFIASIRLILQSRYLLLLLCVVLGYNVFMVLLESIWKGSINAYKNYLVELFKQTMPLLDARKFAEKEIKNVYFLQNIFVGLLSLFIIFFFSRTVSKKRWSLVAFVTPFIGGVMSLLFMFSYFFIKKFLPEGSSFLGGINPLHLSVLIGLAITVFIKASKYVFFDTSKERAYIPLDEEARVNGKAAIDAIGSRLGKGMSAIFISTVLDPFFSNETVALISFTLLFLILILWIFAILRLSPEYEAKLAASMSANVKPSLDMNQDVNANNNSEISTSISSAEADTDDSSSSNEE